MNLWNFLKDWFFGFIGIDLMMKAIENNQPIPAQAYVQLVFSVVTLILGILNFHRFIYTIIGFFAKPKTYPELKERTHRYAFVLSARNEEAVIGNLIDSIRAQDYPQNLIEIYLVADNCSPKDKTAEIAREKGCHVYERHDPEHARKGYALEWIFAQMKKTIDLENDYFGYVFFDSDNVLAPTYLSKMDDAISEGGFDVCKGYLNIKNLSENWITGINGINFYRNSLCLSRPRAVIGSKAQAINGTGFIARSTVLKDGWHGHEIVEDSEFAITSILKGAKHGFCEEAAYYDEQPATIRLSIRQRLRWSKGSLINYCHAGQRLIWSFFKKPTWQKYDAIWDSFPYSLFSFVWPLLYQIITLILMLATGVSAWGSFLNFLLSTFIGSYIGGLFMGVLVLGREWKKVHFTWWQAILISFVWPFYDISGNFITIASLFMKVTWKPIPHKVVADPKALVKEEEAKLQKGKTKAE